MFWCAFQSGFIFNNMRLQLGAELVTSYRYRPQVAFDFTLGAVRAGGAGGAELVALAGVSIAFAQTAAP